MIKLHKNIEWYPNSKRIKLAFEPYENIINIDGLDYQLDYLDEIKGNKGGNSNIFLLKNPDDLENIDDQLVIKICNLPIEKSNQMYKRRFQREIIALRKAKQENKQRIIKFFNSGILILNGLRFPFYTMEKSDWDLAKYLNKNDIDYEQKVLLCIEVIEGFKELHSLDIYHRDIKHDNIFLFGKECKIGDLGLARFRDDDIKFLEKEIGNRIGAFGWESPETMNKYLTEENEKATFDCEIDNVSDVFQLGKLFWYIFQGNLPIGQIVYEDFLFQNPDIFGLIFQMLQYSKNQGRRIQNIYEVENHLKPIAKNLELI
ncbi:MAG TPA: protein kinase [Bacteroidales bacterium]|nr:protein kinase [Bacteroidales bacterium]HRX96334.1 protein kinase [Bacteroidales bacterium]